MLRSESVSQSFMSANDINDISAPIRPQASADGRTFSSLFSAVRAEVMEFIENGSAAPGAMGLSAEGRIYRAGLTPVAASDATAAGLQDAGAEGGEQQAFLASIAPWAKEIAQRLGVSADVIAAQAALESGWGRAPLRHADGRDSNNLFGIKAGGNWQGEVADARTTEYEQGTARHMTERFRSFPDRASAFRDFARLLIDNPRYRSALNTGNDARAYAQGLMRGGYATDPDYADKLVRVASRIQSRE